MQKHTTANIILGIFLLLTVVLVTQPPAIFKVLLVFDIMLGASYFVYRFSDAKDLATPINLQSKSLIPSIIFGAVLGLGFFLFTRLVPGASIGLPLLPGAISDQLRYIVVAYVAPVAEEIFFRGALLGYFLLVFGKNKKVRVIVLQAFLFAVAHISAYITGFYNYPNIVQGLDAVTANLASFSFPFIFGLIAGWAVLRNNNGKVNKGNLVVSILTHSVINHIVYLALTTVILI